MATIKAPFNFVPVSDKVFFPDWADKISHDIPFEDGESGVIELKITAESPIFVRNGHTKADAENKNDDYKSFSKIDDRYFIPATTIKGAVRNVLEIMSFGKMNRVNDDSFGVRDLSSATNSYMTTVNGKQYCGWLQYTNNRYELIDCEKPGRISIAEIDNKFKTNIDAFVTDRRNFEKDAGRMAKEKYKQLGKENFLTRHCFEKDETLQNFMEQHHNHQTREFYKFGEGKKGIVVLTGQSGYRQKYADNRLGKGKYYEFIFFDTNNSPVIVENKVIQSFKTVHKSSPDFTEFWEPKLNRGEKIPVFFVKNSDGTIHSMGLSYLYKYPYQKSVREAIPYSKTQQHPERFSNDADLADCIFGYTNKEKSLKGRVQFSAAFSENAELDEEKCLILGSPKASYYPLYIRQTGRNDRVSDYQTYDNGNIAGWKRYVLRKEPWEHRENSEILNTMIYPLKKESVFTCKVRYHNLKKMELGALISAITFHNMPNCYHQIGQAKPYGYGKISIITNLTDEQKELVKLFEDAVRKDIGQEWRDSEQIVELFTMAAENVNNIDNYSYMKMSNNRDDNEFLKVKSDKNYLEKFSIKIGKMIIPSSDLISLEQQLKNEYDFFVEKAKQLKKEEKYNEALIKLNEADKILPLSVEAINIQSEIKSILQEKDKKEKEAERQDEQIKRDKEKVESGLAFLEEKNLRDEYKVVDFKGAKVRIDQWMKKAKTTILPVEHHEMLKNTLVRLRANPDKKESKDWSNFNSDIWKTLQIYIGKEGAEEWFNEFKH